MVDTRSAAATAHDNVWFERAARAGFAASGILHLLIAFIVARLALGSGGSADQSGALATLAAQPGGAVMLSVAAFVLAALGVWYLVETFLTGDATDRVTSVAVGSSTPRSPSRRRSSRWAVASPAVSRTSA